MLVAFVCTGNICRSPMAEGFARARHSSPGVAFVSYGTGAIDGAAASTRTLRVMAEAGISLDGHVSRGLEEVAASQPDLIYTMTASQAAQVRRLYPELASRVRLLDGRDIADPYGLGLEHYIAARDQIAAALARRAGDWADGKVRRSGPA